MNPVWAMSTIRPSITALVSMTTRFVAALDPRARQQPAKADSSTSRLYIVAASMTPGQQDGRDRWAEGPDRPADLGERHAEQEPITNPTTIAPTPRENSPAPASLSFSTARRAG
jgi:hypothetical protein